MKKIILFFALAIVLMSFTSSSEVKNDLTINKGISMTNVNTKILTWTSCTVGDLGGVQYTVACDCSVASACRKARRLMRRAQ